jgi:hypothetical protein
MMKYDEHPFVLQLNYHLLLRSPGFSHVFPLILIDIAAYSRTECITQLEPLILPGAQCVPARFASVDMR